MKQVIKNDFFDLNREDIDTLFALEEKMNAPIEFMGHTYLISKNTINNTTIFLFHDLTPVIEFHMTLLLIALIGSIFALFIIYFLARYLAHITIAPIREQARELESYSHNVAHELRTPLSIMRSNLELLSIRPEARFIESTNEEITGMEKIIETLLFIAKPDGSDNKKEIDITSQTKEIIEKYNETNIIQYSHDKKHIMKRANTELYKRIVCNLIENAIKYKSDGNIDIELKKTGIKISNPIEHNLSEEETSNLTKIFYQ